MASAAATTTSASTAAGAQNPNPFNNLNIKLPPWLSGLRCPLSFLCPPAPAPPPPPPPPPLPPPEPVVPRSRRLPSLRVTTEYDSEEGVFVNKVSCKLAGDLAKLRLSFQSDPQGQWQGGSGEEGEGDPLKQLFAAPLVGLVTKHFSVLYDIEARNALLTGDCSLPGGAVQLRASHDVKAQQGEVSVITRLGDPLYKLELSSLVPYSGLPRATFHFPIGQVSVEERRNEDDEKVLSVYGIGKSDFLDGVLTAQYNENDLKLRYCYKDKELTLVPIVSLPSNAVSIGLKRRFGPDDKLSYHYSFDTDDWNAVYKHTVGKNFKVKAGYDSEVRVGWASLWVGEEGGKAKTAPMKTRLQLMLQVPQDNPRNPVFLFNVKKRWDL